MRHETSVVYLEQVPKLVIDSGYDTATILSFLATIAIFVLGTFLTIRSSNKNAAEQRRIFDETIKNQETALERTLKSQENIAKAGAIKVSRQEWINDLRDCCARYISLILTINAHMAMKEATEALARDLSLKDKSEGTSMVVAWSSKASELRAQVYDLKFRIELMANPSEELFVELVGYVDAAISMCEDSKSADVAAVCHRIKHVAQKILKIEWDRTRNML